MELSEFLLARIAEDEAVARMPPPGPWSFSGPVRETSVYSASTGVTVAHVWQRDAHHIAHWDPARVLAECEAKRRIVEHCTPMPFLTGDLDTLRLLALPYAKHPDYRREWKP